MRGHGAACGGAERAAVGRGGHPRRRRVRMRVRRPPAAPAGRGDGERAARTRHRRGTDAYPADFFWFFSDSSPCARGLGTRRIHPDAVRFRSRRLFAFLRRVPRQTHSKVVCRVPEIWHTANSAFAVPVVAVGASPCATLGEIFTVCPGGFAVCLGHTAKPPRHTAKIFAEGRTRRSADGNYRHGKGRVCRVPNFGHTANNFAVCLSRYLTASG